MKTSKLSLFALLISILALLLCSYLLFDEKRFDADWGQVITGVLSFLVTILIAWQIWVVIDTKNIIKELQNENIKTQIHFANEYSKLSAGVYYSLFDFFRKDGLQVYEYFKYGLLTLNHSIKVGDYGASNAMIKGLIESFPTSPIRNFDKAQLLRLIDDVPRDNKLINLEELKSKIILMPSSDNI